VGVYPQEAAGSTVMMRQGDKGAGSLRSAGRTTRPFPHKHCRLLLFLPVYRLLLIGSDVDLAAAVYTWIASEIGAAIDGVGGAAGWITPANAAGKAGAPGIYGWRSRGDVEVWGSASQIDELRIRVGGVCVFAGCALIA